MNPCNYLRRIVCLGILSILSIAHGPAVMGSDTEEETGPLKFGVLPVIQALPVFVAAEKGFFKESGIEVEIVPFNSSMEKDVAMSAGAISGYFGDLMTPMVLRANGVPVKIVSTIFQTTPTQRMFAVLAAPGSVDKSLEELMEEGIAGSSNTIIEYILYQDIEVGRPARRKIHHDRGQAHPHKAPDAPFEPGPRSRRCPNLWPRSPKPKGPRSFWTTPEARDLVDEFWPFVRTLSATRPEAVKRFHKGDRQGGRCLSGKTPRKPGGS